MTTFRDVLPQDSEFWEACARHTSRQTTRTVNAIYLCDKCAIRLTSEAFNKRPPIYHGETIKGFCGLCNDMQGVTLRLWFACPMCWNVIVAYQKGFAASKAVQDYWRGKIANLFPDLQLLEKDEIRLLPYVRAKIAKKTAALSLTSLDFLVINSQQNPLFHIELKAGPGSIEEMKEFQLDINDSNDVIGVVNNTKLPAYIFHAQIVYQYAPPTRRAVPLGIWWTDIFTLLENRLAIRGRRDEAKAAGYYSPQAFRPFDEFLDELRNKRYEQLSERVLTDPLSLT